MDHLICLRYDRWLPFYVSVYLDVWPIPDAKRGAAVTSVPRILAYVNHLIPYYVADDRSATNARSWMADNGFDRVD